MMKIRMEYASERDASKVISDLCNKVAYDRLRVVITDDTGDSKLAIVPIRHGELLVEYAKQMKLNVASENATSVESPEGFAQLSHWVIESNTLVFIMQQSRPRMALVPLSHGLTPEFLEVIDVDDLLALAERDAGCTEAPEFEQAIRMVGEMPYEEIARSLAEVTHASLLHLVQTGAPTPEAFLERRQVNAQPSRLQTIVKSLVQRLNGQREQ